MSKAFVIAGERSGCGKTLVALGIMAALRRRGHTVQPFKAGPDFIDPGHHETVCGRHSHNLDAWMTGEEGVREIFSRYAADSDVAVIEGVMGLYDGLSGRNEAGSTAQLAKLLGAPVLLVLDARSLARSAAALVSGYTGFDPDLDFAGLVFNRVGSQNHGELIGDAVSSLPGVHEIIGCLPRDEALAMPSRHLGLITRDEAGLDDAASKRLAAWAGDNLALPRLLALLPEVATTSLAEPPPGAKTCRLAVASDRAFCFAYHENLRLLERHGAEILPFSPLEDSGLPEQVDALYLPGGYPEEHAAALSANEEMIRDLRSFALAGGPVYAECGGFMYLMSRLTDREGRTWPMAGVFDMSAEMRPRFSALGYREIVTNAPGPFGPAWTMLRGHEFHYSNPEAPDPEAETLYKVADRKGWTDLMEGFRKYKVLGSYIHLHFRSNPEAAKHFVEWCAGKSG
jgi:cobyrinic acid a,c-diamide synthase